MLRDGLQKHGWPLCQTNNLALTLKGEKSVELALSLGQNKPVKATAVMYFQPFSVVLAATALATAASRPSSPRATTNATSNYLARMADTHLRRGVTPDFDYTNAVLYRGLELAYTATQNATILSFLSDQLTTLVPADDGAIAGYNYSFHSLDEYRIGMDLLWAYNRTGASKWQAAATRVRSMLDAHPRNSEGGFWHRSPTYPDQMWLDGIFMADSFYAAYTSLFQPTNTTAWADILLQYQLIERHCRNATLNLLVHGYDASKTAVWADPVTGASPLVWDRAVGWYFVSLLEAIAVWPATDTAGRSTLVGYFTSLASGLLAAQDEDSGGWWLVMSEEYVGREENYIESSGTAMFTYGFLRGVREGLLDGEVYLDAGRRAYEGMVERFVVETEDGTLDWEGTVKVGSLSSNATFEVS
jgi:rhamnogalacturonyl hydrolase YesR